MAVGREYLKTTKPIDVFQTGLDLAGFVPVYGEVADAANAVVYLARGRVGDALLSGAACIPILGSAATGSKMVAKGVKTTDNIMDAAELVKAGQKTAEAYEALKDTAKQVDNIQAAAGVVEEVVVKSVKEAAEEAAEEAVENAVEEVAEEAVEKAIKNGTEALSGQWKVVNESMSDFSKAYQKQITGQEGMTWVQNGVKFDGIKDGVLLDAKGKYAQFIDKSTGEFYGWFSGKNSLVAEARRQIDASEGAKIQWYFAEEESLNVVQDLFMDKGITEIELIFEALK